jgi:hypothetical protein
MAFNTFGSAAGGFMTAFLAAKRLQMQQQFYLSRESTFGSQQKMLDAQAAYYKKLADSTGGNSPNAAGQTAHDAKVRELSGGTGGGSKVDTTTASTMIPRMMKDYGLTREQATGAVGVMGYESGDFKTLQEKGQPDGKGGWGYAQWTGPRREQFMQYAKDNNLDPKSDAANYGFMQKELASPAYAGVIPAMKQTTTSQDAGKVWLGQYEGMNLNGQGPGVPAVAGHLQRVQDYANAFAPAGQPTQLSGASATPAAPATYAPQPVANAPLPPPRPTNLEQPPAGVTPQSNTPAQAIPVTATPTAQPPSATPAPQVAPQPSTVAPPILAPSSSPSAIPADQASADEPPPAFAGKRGGPVQKYALGGAVKAYDLGGSTADEDEDTQFENEDRQTDYEDAALSGSSMPPGGANPSAPALIQPPQSAIPAPGPPQSQGTQIASNGNPFMMSMRVPSGGGGVGMRMGGSGGGGGRGGVGAGPRGLTDPGSVQSGYHASDPTTGEPLPPDTPQVMDDQGNLSPGAGSAIAGGMAWIAKQLGGAQGQNGAIPGGPQADQARQDLLQSKGASRDEMDQVNKAVDPNGQLKGAIADIAGLEGMHTWYMQHNMPEEANKAAASIIMMSKDAASRYGDQALNYFIKGDVDEGVKAAVKGYDQILDGHSLEVKKGDDGKYTATQLNMQGREVWKKQIAPQEIFQAALGLKDGSLTMKLYAEQGQKFDPSIGAQNAEMTPADQAAYAKLQPGGGQPQQGAIPTAPQGGSPQAIPMANVGGATPSAAPAQAASSGPGAPPPAQAVPMQNVGGATPSAIPPTPSPQGGAPPVTPASNAPPVQTSEPTSAVPPDLPQTVLDAHQRNLDAQLGQLQQQILAPVMATRPQADAQYLASVANDPRRKQAYIAAVQQADKQWQDTQYAPAMARFNDNAKYIRDQNASDLSGAREALRHTWQDDAQTRRQSAADALQAKRLDANNANQSQRDEDKANLEFQRQVVNRPVPEKMNDPDGTSDLALHDAFAPNGTAPEAAKDLFEKQLQPNERRGLRDATTEIVRLNQDVPPDTAATVVKMLTMDKADDPKDAAFKVTPLKNFAGGASGNFVRVSPVNPTAGYPSVIMGADHFLSIMKARAGLIDRMDTTQRGQAEDERRQGALDQARQAYSDRHPLPKGFDAAPSPFMVPQGRDITGQAIPTQ